MKNIVNVPTNNGMTINNSNHTAPPPVLPVIPVHSTENKRNDLNGTTVKHYHDSRKKSSTLFDLRRVKKIRKLDRKIRSIKSGASKELQREIEKIKKERRLKLEQLKEARSSEVNDSRQRHNVNMKEIAKETNERIKTLQIHLHKELQRIRNKIINNKKNSERATFEIVSVSTEKGKENIRICFKRNKASENNDIKADINSIFDNWQNEIHFNTKIRTRQQTKNKTSFIKYKNGTDLSRIRFHLREDQIKCDLRFLLDKEQEHNEREGITRKRSSRSNNDIDEDIQNAFHHQPSYFDRHISGITNKLGPLNDPCIEDPLYRRGSTRRRANRVNYQDVNVFNNGMSHNPSSNMYHAQDVHFFASVNTSFAKTNYNGIDGESVLIPVEERGHQVTVSSFTVHHGSVVRLNYLGNNTTIDAMVVSIKKNQLSAITLVGKKRKRIWYKELRIGKINIAPATAYR